MTRTKTWIVALVVPLAFRVQRVGRGRAIERRVWDGASLGQPVDLRADAERRGARASLDHGAK
jgi:hypothetical protein